MPAWEFPDVPDHEFDCHPQNNWVAMANRSAMVIVGGQFTVDAMHRAGVTAPVRIVPVPTDAGYFDTPDWDENGHTVLKCSAIVYPQPPSSPMEFRAQDCCSE